MMGNLSVKRDIAENPREDKNIKWNNNNKQFQEEV